MCVTPRASSSMTSKTLMCVRTLCRTQNSSLSQYHFLREVMRTMFSEVANNVTLVSGLMYDPCNCQSAGRAISSVAFPFYEGASPDE